LARELGKAEIDDLCSEIDRAQAAAPSLPFIIDMKNVGFAGSLAMGTLIGLNQEFRTRGQRLIFVSLQAAVEQALHVMRINRIIEIMPDTPAALQSIENQAEPL
jgi:anti-anti-sigma factor